MVSIDRIRCLAGLLTLVTAIPVHNASAASSGTCSINVVSGGVLKPNPILTTLSTKNAGGTAGRVLITANAGGTLPSALCLVGLPLNCMKVSVTSPSSFNAAPPTGNNNVSMVSSFNQVGSSSALNLLSLVILNGTYSFDFDLVATKTSGTFGGGTYQVSQTILCE